MLTVAARWALGAFLQGRSAVGGRNSDGPGFLSGCMASLHLFQGDCEHKSAAGAVQARQRARSSHAGASVHADGVRAGLDNAVLNTFS
jgi:hypothetical protein